MNLQVSRLNAAVLPDRISSVGIAAINSMLHAYGLVRLPDWFSPQWENEQVDPGMVVIQRRDGSRVPERPVYRGKFPTRVEKYQRVQVGLDVPEELKSAIGATARRHYLPGGTWYFDFTDRVDWNAGAFGDAGSCFWGDHSPALDVLLDGGALAIRFYQSCPEVAELLAIEDPGEYNGQARWLAGQGYGLGRAWIMNYDSWCVLFNGYADHEYLGGFDHGDSVTCWMGQILAYYLNEPYRRIYLCNGGSTTGILWINSGVGVAVGDTSCTSWDLNLTTEMECEGCGCGVTDDEVVFDNEGYAYCYDCYWERYFRCSMCGDTYPSDELYTAEDGDYNYCPDCARQYLYTCEGCGADYREVTEVRGVPYCDGCLEALCVECAECGELMDSGNAYAADNGSLLCHECFDAREEADD